MKELILSLILLTAGAAFAKDDLHLAVSHGAIVNIRNNRAEPITLVGYGTYGMVAQSELRVGNTIIEHAFDYDAFFTRLKTVRAGQKPINLVRVWANYFWANNLTPFNGLPKNDKDTDRRKRYDFSPNELFYQRLERFVAAANAHGIVVQLDLTDAVGLEQQRLRWENNPWNIANNRDRSALTSPGGCFAISGPIWARNQEVVYRIIRELARYGNVIYQIMNEPDVSAHGASDDAVVRWHAAMLATIREALALAGQNGSKLVSVNAGRAKLSAWAANAEVDILSIHLGHDDNAATYNVTSHLGRKPLIVSNDGHRSCEASLDSHARATLAAQWLRKILAADGPGSEGRIHFEFLDNGMVANYGTPDYDPVASRASEETMNALKTR